MAASSTLSRRLSEVLGVALFGAALIWLVALFTYEPSDPAWFFNIGSGLPPANFIGRVGAFLAELSFQLFGYAAYLIPGAFVVVGWQCFWCRAVDAAYTKIVGAALLFGCISAFLSLALGHAGGGGLPFPPGGWFGDWLASRLSDSFNTSGSVIVIVTLFFLGLILSTQVSFGRLFLAIVRFVREGWTRRAAALAAWRDERRRDRQRTR